MRRAASRAGGPAPKDLVPAGSGSLVGPALLQPQHNRERVARRAPTALVFPLALERGRQAGAR